MEGRRRLLLLAVIVVAVAIGTVGITLLSLFGAGMEQERAALLQQVQAGSLPESHRLVELPLSSAEPDAALPAVLRAQLPPAAPDGPLWLDAPGYLAVVAGTDSGTLRVAWSSLEELRAPFRRAALQALAGMLALVALGLWLFYRMTAPLLRSIELSEARYRTLFSSTAEGVLLIGNGIEECNDRFCEMFQCRRQDVLGLPWRDFFRRYAGSAAGLAEFEGKVQLLLDDRGQSFTWAFQAPSGLHLVAEVALRRLRDGDRELILVSLRDVTERETTSRELQEAERALRESREKLAEAGRSSALVELAAGIAHEVNQPLAAIANYAQACRRMIVAGRPCSDDVSASLDRIAEQARRAGEAIHRIRALVPATPARGAARTSVNRLVAEVADMLHDDFARAQASLVLDCEPQLPPVMADSLQIQQVLVQLLRNALEAMEQTPAAAREVRVSTRRCEGDRVEVEVCDSGHGIAADDRSRIFEPFYSTRENGMGMGLAISLSIIGSHHGELDVDEAREQGASVRFRLPADTRPAME